ncbi:MAG: D-aminoacylase [Chloroflexi bacterium]|nr:D-aminoacylase [Chloroflexota bacterium]
MFDILITNGTVVDGTGRPRFQADVGITGGKIDAVGSLGAAEAPRTIDATGLVIAPGFIDMHSHSDTTMLSDPSGDSKAYQGVTTEVTGNCSSSPYPVAADPHLAEYQRSTWPFLKPDWDWTDLDGWAEYTNSSGISLNIAPQVGQGEIRKAVGLNQDRPPTTDEMKEMRRLAAEAIEQGAFSLSTGLTIVPSSFASTDELVELTEAISPFDGAFYVTHSRWRTADHTDAAKEAIEIGRRAGVPIQYSHMAIIDPRAHGDGASMVAVFDRARDEGLDATYDMYPYVAAGSGVGQLLPEWSMEGGNEEVVRRLRDPETRRRIAIETVEGFFSGTPIPWDTYMVSDAFTAANAGNIGRSVAEIAEMRGTDVLETALTLLIEEGGDVPTTVFNRNEGDVRFFMGHEAAMFGSDGYAFSPTGPLATASGDHKASHVSGKPHPRNYGTFPRVLGRYVREQQVLSLESAVHKMTGFPAQRLRLKDRGLVQQGFVADLTLFNPDTVVDRATFDKPSQFPDGIPYVFVAGEAIIFEGKHTGATPGRVLRRGE